MNTALAEKVLAAEAAMGGAQVTWASTPRAVPALRSKAVASGIMGSRRQYAFKCEADREAFVYARNDTLFTVSRDMREPLGLGPVAGGGTSLRSWEPSWVAGQAARAPKAPAPSAPTPAPLPVAEAPTSAPRVNKFRKQANATS